MKRKISFHATIFGLVLLLGMMSAVAQTNFYQQGHLPGCAENLSGSRDVNGWATGVESDQVSRSKITWFSQKRPTSMAVSRHGA